MAKINKGKDPVQFAKSMLDRVIELTERETVQVKKTSTKPQVKKAVKK